MPFLLVGLLEISISFASIKTCLVGVSNCTTNLLTAACSADVATTINWLVRVSGNTRLRLSVNVACTESIMFVVPAYLSWITWVVSGGKAAGSLMVIR